MSSAATCRAAALLAIAVCMPGFAQAAEPRAESDELGKARGHLYLGGLFMEPDSDRDIDEKGTGVQVNLGWNLGGQLYLEGHLFAAEFERGDDRGTDFYHRGLGLDLQYAFGNREAPTPFLLLGVGGVDNDVVPDERDDTTFFANAGVGLVGRLLRQQWLRWRVEGRYLYDNFLDGVTDWRLGAGLEIAFARQQAARTIVKEREVIKEVAVYPKDSDGDGIVDQYDQCPDTLAGAEVNGRGCVEKPQTVTLDNVNFEFDSAKLTLNAERLLDNAVAFLEAQQNVVVEIAGHTDHIGSDAYNLKLSQARAESVRDYLVANGIAASRLEAVGYGESQPVDSNESDRGRARNRRTEFRIDISGPRRTETR